MGAKGSVEAAKINAQNWNSLEVRVLQRTFLMLLFCCGSDVEQQISDCNLGLFCVDSWV